MFAVEMQHVTKRFGNLTAIHEADFNVRNGEIHALIGENGAGKSTLMRILYGFYSPDSGTLQVQGRTVAIKSPADSIRLGIGMVHQHFMLIPPFTVAENIVLGEEITKGYGFLDLSQASKQLKALSEIYRLNIDPNARVANLSIGFQQRIEILKILFRKAQIVILDEPTPILAPQEIEGLFEILAALKNEGKTIILITHKLSEVMRISDRVTVMRHGVVVGERETRSTSESELAHLMIGEDVEASAGKVAASNLNDVLQVSHVSAGSDRGHSAIEDISFTIRRGEILGIAGIEGNGQSELVQVVAGLRSLTKGEIRIATSAGRIGPSPHACAHIPEDRLKHALVLDFTLQDNLILGRHRESEYSNHLLLRFGRILDYSRKLIEEFDVRPDDPLLPARSLSGGNQQKAVVARELSKDAPLIIASQPTRGLDIRAIQYIHNSLIRQRNSGKAILLVSSDLAEILKLSDRIAVLFEGRIAATFNAQETNDQELGLYMTGSHKKSA